MKIETLFVNNALRNFNYLIVCEKTREAWAIDPLDANGLLTLAHDKHYRITHIINTHEHGDHTQGNALVVAATGAIVMAHHDAIDKIPCATRPLVGGEQFKIGESVTIDILNTPGHTMAHVCVHAHHEHEHALFSGDTLFNAGCGNCYNGGNVSAMYQTATHLLQQLPQDTKLYPGHEYLENNLKFSYHCNKHNPVVSQLLEQKIWQQFPYFVSTLKLEKTISPFFQLDNPEIVAFTKHSAENPEAIFATLRAYRDKW